MITFISTAYKETIDAYCFISSLLLQNNNNWKCIIVCDGYNEYINKICLHFNDSRITFTYSPDITGYWGHYNRKKSLNLVETEWVIQTSIQDYFTPNAVNEIYNNVDKYDLIYYNSLHNHFDYDILDTELRIGKIDWGNFCIKTDIAKKIGINYPQSNICDGIFIEECLRYPGLKINKINKILTIHN